MGQKGCRNYYCGSPFYRNDSTKKVTITNMMTKCPALKTVVFSKTGWVFAKTSNSSEWNNPAVTTVIRV